jgi:hypothetical protein
MVKHEHTIHQSWLNEFLLCPERARLGSAHEYPREEDDATARGTAVHASIEAVLIDCLDFNSALQAGVDTFETLAAEPGFAWKKVKTKKTALEHVQGGFTSWYRHVLPTLGSTVWCEERFDFVLHEDDQRVIRIAGTVDYAEQYGLADWKLTANTDKYGKRDGWQQKRWAVQPTFYAAAAYEAGLFPRSEAVPFAFWALSPMGRKPQLLRADRTWEHVQWLKQQLVFAAVTIEADLPVWPVNDQHALCSELWCPAWHDCKGKHFAPPEVGSAVELTTK